MDKKEYYKNVMSCDVDDNKVEAISRIYNAEISDELKHFISYADKVDFFDDERRALRYAEIENPADVMEIDFVGMGYVPIVDAYDNSYIVYILKDSIWARYNSIDDMVYVEGQNIEDLL